MDQLFSKNRKINGERKSYDKSDLLRVIYGS